MNGEIKTARFNSDNSAKTLKLQNNLTIPPKVFIYNPSKQVYYCIHVERKGALCVLFVFHFREQADKAKISETNRDNSIERREELCLM